MKKLRIFGRINPLNAAILAKLLVGVVVGSLCLTACGNVKNLANTATPNNSDKNSFRFTRFPSFLG